MEQLKEILPKNQEEIRYATDTNNKTEPIPSYLDKVRSKFGLYGSISLIFAAAFTLLFYKTAAGLNVFAFTVLIINLLNIIMQRLNIQMKAGTRFYYAGVLLLGGSTVLTSSEVLQFLNIIGILLLLDLSLLHQLNQDNHWEFIKYLSRMVGILFTCIACIKMPIIDGINYVKRTKYLKNEFIRNILFGLILSLPVAFVALILLSKADMVFGEITKRLFEWMFSSDIFIIIIMLIFGFFSCYCIICGFVMKSNDDKSKEQTKADALIAVTFMVVLCMVYALFCTIQIVYLFTNGLLELPAGFTYAEYARRGFFELLAVTLINIILMILCNSFFKENRLLRIVITVMTIGTYIMIASAAYRMLLYIGAYQLTFLRLFVLLALFIDALVLVGIMIEQYKKEFPLFRYCVVVISICYIVFSFSKPDYYIASYLAKNKEVLNREDCDYLTGQLSLDAAPIVVALLSDNSRWAWDNGVDMKTITWFQFYKKDYYDRISSVNKNFDIRDFNFSRYQAQSAIKKKPYES